LEQMLIFLFEPSAVLKKFFVLLANLLLKKAIREFFNFLFSFFFLEYIYISLYICYFHLTIIESKGKEELEMRIYSNKVSSVIF
jgi:hypothetical protein